MLRVYWLQVILVVLSSLAVANAGLTVTSPLPHSENVVADIDFTEFYQLNNQPQSSPVLSFGDKGSKRAIGEFQLVDGKPPLQGKKPIYGGSNVYGIELPYGVENDQAGFYQTTRTHREIAWYAANAPGAEPPAIITDETVPNNVLDGWTWEIWFTPYKVNTELASTFLIGTSQHHGSVLAKRNPEKDCFSIGFITAPYYDDLLSEDGIYPVSPCTFYKAEGNPGFPPVTLNATNVLSASIRLSTGSLRLQLNNGGALNDVLEVVIPDAYELQDKPLVLFRTLANELSFRGVVHRIIFHNRFLTKPEADARYFHGLPQVAPAVQTDLHIAVARDRDLDLPQVDSVVVELASVFLDYTDPEVLPQEAEVEFVNLNVTIPTFVDPADSQTYNCYALRYKADPESSYVDLATSTSSPQDIIDALAMVQLTQTSSLELDVVGPISLCYGSEIASQAELFPPLASAETIAEDVVSGARAGDFELSMNVKFPGTNTYQRTVRIVLRPRQHPRSLYAGTVTPLTLAASFSALEEHRVEITLAMFELAPLADGDSVSTQLAFVNILSPPQLDDSVSPLIALTGAGSPINDASGIRLVDGNGNVITSFPAQVAVEDLPLKISFVPPPAGSLTLPSTPRTLINPDNAALTDSENKDNLVIGVKLSFSMINSLGDETIDSVSLPVRVTTPIHTGVSMEGRSKISDAGVLAALQARRDAAVLAPPAGTVGTGDVIMTFVDEWVEVSIFAWRTDTMTALNSDNNDATIVITSLPTKGKLLKFVPADAPIPMGHRAEGYPAPQSIVHSAFEGLYSQEDFVQEADLPFAPASHGLKLYYIPNMDAVPQGAAAAVDSLSCLVLHTESGLTSPSVQTIPIVILPVMRSVSGLLFASTFDRAYLPPPGTDGGLFNPYLLAEAAQELIASSNPEDVGVGKGLLVTKNRAGEFRQLVSTMLEDAIAAAGLSEVPEESSRININELAVTDSIASGNSSPTSRNLLRTTLTEADAAAAIAADELLQDGFAWEPESSAFALESSLYFAVSCAVHPPRDQSTGEISQQSADWLALQRPTVSTTSRLRLAAVKPLEDPDETARYPELLQLTRGITVEAWMAPPALSNAKLEGGFTANAITAGVTFPLLSLGSGHEGEPLAATTARSVQIVRTDSNLTVAVLVKVYDEGHLDGTGSAQDVLLELTASVPPAEEVGSVNHIVVTAQEVPGITSEDHPSVRVQLFVNGKVVASQTQPRARMSNWFANERAEAEASDPLATPEDIAAQLGPKIYLGPANGVTALDLLQTPEENVDTMLFVAVYNRELSHREVTRQTKIAATHLIQPTSDMLAFVNNELGIALRDEFSAPNTLARPPALRHGSRAIGELNERMQYLSVHHPEPIKFELVGASERFTTCFELALVDPAGFAPAEIIDFSTSTLPLTTIHSAYAANAHHLPEGFVATAGQFLLRLRSRLPVQSAESIAAACDDLASQSSSWVAFQVRAASTAADVVSGRLRLTALVLSRTPYAASPFDSLVTATSAIGRKLTPLPGNLVQSVAQVSSVPNDADDPEPVSKFEFSEATVTDPRFTLYLETDSSEPRVLRRLTPANRTVDIAAISAGKLHILFHSPSEDEVSAAIEAAEQADAFQPPLNLATVELAGAAINTYAKTGDIKIYLLIETWLQQFVSSSDIPRFVRRMAEQTTDPARMLCRADVAPSLWIPLTSPDSQQDGLSLPSYDRSNLEELVNPAQFQFLTWDDEQSDAAHLTFLSNVINSHGKIEVVITKLPDMGSLYALPNVEGDLGLISSWTKIEEEELPFILPSIALTDLPSDSIRYQQWQAGEIALAPVAWGYPPSLAADPDFVVASSGQIKLVLRDAHTKIPLRKYAYTIEGDSEQGTATIVEDNSLDPVPQDAVAFEVSRNFEIYRATSAIPSEALVAISNLQSSPPRALVEEVDISAWFGTDTDVTVQSPARAFVLTQQSPENVNLYLLPTVPGSDPTLLPRAVGTAIEVENIARLRVRITRPSNDSPQSTPEAPLFADSTIANLTIAYRVSPLLPASVSATSPLLSVAKTAALQAGGPYPWPAHQADPDPSATGGNSLSEVVTIPVQSWLTIPVPETGTVPMSYYSVPALPDPDTADDPQESVITLWLPVDNQEVWTSLAATATEAGVRLSDLAPLHSGFVDNTPPGPGNLAAWRDIIPSPKVTAVITSIPETCGTLVDPYTGAAITSNMLPYVINPFALSEAAASEDENEQQAAQAILDQLQAEALLRAPHNPGRDVAVRFVAGSGLFEGTYYEDVDSCVDAIKYTLKDLTTGLYAHRHTAYPDISATQIPVTVSRTPPIYPPAIPSQLLIIPGPLVDGITEVVAEVPTGVGNAIREDTSVFRRTPVHRYLITALPRFSALLIAGQLITQELLPKELSLAEVENDAIRVVPLAYLADALVTVATNPENNWAEEDPILWDIYQRVQGSILAGATTLEQVDSFSYKAVNDVGVESIDTATIVFNVKVSFPSAPAATALPPVNIQQLLAEWTYGSLKVIVDVPRTAISPKADIEPEWMAATAINFASPILTKLPEVEIATLYLAGSNEPLQQVPYSIPPSACELGESGEISVRVECQLDIRLARYTNFELDHDGKQNPLFLGTFYEESNTRSTTLEYSARTNRSGIPAADATTVDIVIQRAAPSYLPVIEASADTPESSLEIAGAGRTWSSESVPIETDENLVWTSIGAHCAKVYDSLPPHTVHPTHIQIVSLPVQGSLRIRQIDDQFVVLNSTDLPYTVALEALSSIEASYHSPGQSDSFPAAHFTFVPVSSEGKVNGQLACYFKPVSNWITAPPPIDIVLSEDPQENVQLDEEEEEIIVARTRAAVIAAGREIAFSAVPCAAFSDGARVQNKLPILDYYLVELPSPWSPQSGHNSPNAEDIVEPLRVFTWTDDQSAGLAGESLVDSIHLPLKLETSPLDSLPLYAGDNGVSRPSLLIQIPGYYSHPSDTEIVASEGSRYEFRYGVSHFSSAKHGPAVAELLMVPEVVLRIRACERSSGVCASSPSEVRIHIRRAAASKPPHSTSSTADGLMQRTIETTAVVPTPMPIEASFFSQPASNVDIDYISLTAIPDPKVAIILVAENEAEPSNYRVLQSSDLPYNFWNPSAGPNAGNAYTHATAAKPVRLASAPQVLFVSKPVNGSGVSGYVGSEFNLLSNVPGADFAADAVRIEYRLGNSFGIGLEGEDLDASKPVTETRLWTSVTIANHVAFPPEETGQGIRASGSSAGTGSNGCYWNVGPSAWILPLAHHTQLETEDVLLDNARSEWLDGLRGGLNPAAVNALEGSIVRHSDEDSQKSGREFRILIPQLPYFTPSPHIDAESPDYQAALAEITDHFQVVLNDPVTDQNLTLSDLPYVMSSRTIRIYTISTSMRLTSSDDLITQPQLVIPHTTIDQATGGIVAKGRILEHVVLPKLVEASLPVEFKFEPAEAALTLNRSEVRSIGELGVEVDEPEPFAAFQGYAFEVHTNLNSSLLKLIYLDQSLEDVAITVVNATVLESEASNAQELNVTSNSVRLKGPLSLLQKFLGQDDSQNPPADGSAEGSDFAVIDDVPSLKYRVEIPREYLTVLVSGLGLVVPEAANVKAQGKLKFVLAKTGAMAAVPAESDEAVIRVAADYVVPPTPPTPPTPDEPNPTAGGQAAQASRTKVFPTLFGPLPLAACIAIWVVIFIVGLAVLRWVIVSIRAYHVRTLRAQVEKAYECAANNTALQAALADKERGTSRELDSTSPVVVNSSTNLTCVSVNITNGSKKEGDDTNAQSTAEELVQVTSEGVSPETFTENALRILEKTEDPKINALIKSFLTATPLHKPMKAHPDNVDGARESDSSGRNLEDSDDSDPELGLNAEDARSTVGGASSSSHATISSTASAAQLMRQARIMPSPSTPSASSSSSYGLTSPRATALPASANSERAKARSLLRNPTSSNQEEQRVSSRRVLDFTATAVGSSLPLVRPQTLPHEGPSMASPGSRSALQPTAQPDEVHGKNLDDSDEDQGSRSPAANSQARLLGGPSPLSSSTKLSPDILAWSASASSLVSPSSSSALQGPTLKVHDSTLGPLMSSQHFIAPATCSSPVANSPSPTPIRIRRLASYNPGQSRRSSLQVSPRADPIHLPERSAAEVKHSPQVQKADVAEVSKFGDAIESSDSDDELQGSRFLDEMELEIPDVNPPSPENSLGRDAAGSVREGTPRAKLHEELRAAELAAAAARRAQYSRVFLPQPAVVNENDAEDVARQLLEQFGQVGSVFAEPLPSVSQVEPQRPQQPQQPQQLQQPQQPGDRRQSIIPQERPSEASNASQKSASQEASHEVVSPFAPTKSSIFFDPKAFIAQRKEHQQQQQQQQLGQESAAVPPPADDDGPSLVDLIRAPTVDKIFVAPLQPRSAPQTSSEDESSRESFSIVGPEVVAFESEPVSDTMAIETAERVEIKEAAVAPKHNVSQLTPQVNGPPIHPVFVNPLHGELEEDEEDEVVEEALNVVHIMQASTNNDEISKMLPPTVMENATLNARRSSVGSNPPGATPKKQLPNLPLPKVPKK